MSSKDTILVVDDHPSNLDLLFRHLEIVGFKVLIAIDGDSAIQQAQETMPDIILLDVLMPNMDGFETCRHLKRNKHTRDIPVIFMTALSDIESKIKGFSVGGVDYVTKPIELIEVEARIRTHLTIRKLQQHLETEIISHKKTNAILQARNEELDSFSHTVAHDIKNPLNLISGYAELIADERSSPEEMQRFSRKIMEVTYKIDSIINALQLLTGVRKLEVMPEPLMMGHVIKGALEQIVHLIDEYQAEIKIPDTWPIALGYEPWVEEVWANYLSNAIKYGGQPPILGLGATKQDDMIRFWVKDNGNGLSAEEQEKLFVPFTRLTQLRVEGHGLGLSIVRRIMQKLNGIVGVESEIGKGSCFSFSLPIANY